MAPRGLSAEEKRVRLLEIFHESKDFFQLKELEKLGPKLKGIVSQSVKEVLQGLVDDGLVQADKIGSSNFFWSFPSQRGAIMNNRLSAAKEVRANLQVQLQDLQENSEKEKLLRPDNDERASALEELESTKVQLTELEKELAQYGSCDPAKIEAKRRATKLAHEAAVRWTDNVGILIPYMSRQNGTDPNDIRAYLEIGEDFEDIC
ncbi:MND1 [Sanghuangporus weigelae]